MEWLTERSTFAGDDSQGFTIPSNIVSSCEWAEIPRPAGPQQNAQKTSPDGVRQGLFQ
jgi:hypothetical protein